MCQKPCWPPYLPVAPLSRTYVPTLRDPTDLQHSPESCHSLCRSCPKFNTSHLSELNSNSHSSVRLPYRSMSCCNSWQPSSLSTMPPTFVSSANLQIIQTIGINDKQQWAQHQTLRHTTSHRPPVWRATFHHHPLFPFMKPIFYPFSYPSLRSNLPEQPSKQNLVECLAGPYIQSLQLCPQQPFLSHLQETIRFVRHDLPCT